MLTQPTVAIISQYCMYCEIHPIYLKLIQWCISIIFNKTTRKHFWFSKLMNKRQYLCRLYWTTKYFKWNRGTKYLFSWVCLNKVRGTKMQTNEQLEGLSDMCDCLYLNTEMLQLEMNAITLFPFFYIFEICDRPCIYSLRELGMCPVHE